jgi:exodeoxyribonuclease V beta subunit
VSTGAGRPLVARDVADQIVALLAGDATITLDDDPPRPVCAGDIAVVTRTHDQATLVHDALLAARVPVVLSGSRSVFATEAARQWLTLLRAVEQPHRPGLARAAALGCFLGWSPGVLAEPDGDASDRLGALLREWRDLLVTRGVAAMFEVVAAGQGLTERLLARLDGERELTDLRHVAELLHDVAVSDRLGPAALVEWLGRRIAEPELTTSSDRSWRLDSDADAVQVVTIHASKGLEFPIVCVPYGWDLYIPDDPDRLRLHDEAGHRLLDVGGRGGPSYAEHRALHKAEEAGEHLRLLYVAMTRAQCQVLAWWVPATTAVGAPLHRLLFGDAAPGGQPPAIVSLPDDESARDLLADWAAAGGDAIEVGQVGDPAGVAWQPPARSPGELEVARFDRGVDLAWRRTSYSGLTAGLHEARLAGVTSEPEATEVEDEPADALVRPADAPTASGADEAGLRAVLSPMAELPAGAAFGTLVHEVLEHVDTDAQDLASELLARCEQASARLGGGVDPAELAASLLPVMRTPLGPVAGGATLADVRPGDHLAELTFELPMAGGDVPVLAGTVARLAAVLRAHLPADDPLAEYPDELDAAGIGAEQLRGYLTGSIDSVLRLGGGSEARYVIVDYKTNWLGDPPGVGVDPLTAWHYRPSAMAAEMRHAHYPLQAILYSVALHRYLRWRQPGYDPTRHLGGVLYLFVRGMCGPETPLVGDAPTGVFAWSPPAALVAELSDLLAGAPSVVDHAQMDLESAE